MGVYCLLQETDLYPPASQNITRAMLVFMLPAPGDRKEPFKKTVIVN